MRAIILFFVLFVSCEEAALRDRSRPSEDGADVPGFEAETIQSVEANNPATITISETTLTISSNTLAEDAEVRLRKLKAKPKRDEVAALGDSLGDVIQVTMYDKESEKIFASSLLQQPYTVSQTLGDISDTADLNVVVFTSYGTDREEVQLLGEKALNFSTALTSEGIIVSFELNVTDVVFYSIKSKELPASVTVLNSGANTSNDGGGSVIPSVSSTPSGSTNSAAETDVTLSNRWTTVQEGASNARNFHATVWTGSEMIVWGGNDGTSLLNTGGRYNPSTNSWASTPTLNAPESRMAPTAVWTGSKMIVWGGYDGGDTSLGTGGKFDPDANTWTSTALADHPGARHDHSAVWSGSEMIIWGGYDAGDSLRLYTGGRYNPATNTWAATATAGAPIARHQHTAIWSGSKMIVWGGFDDNEEYRNDGGIYDPTTNSWASLSTVGAPVARINHRALWAGAKMIVWGGYNSNYESLNSGGIYDPESNAWAAISTTNAPSARVAHAAVWTGTQMIVWGGYDGNAVYFASGGVYDLSSNSWTTTATAGAPVGRTNPSAVWTGSAMIVWGGYDGSTLYSGGMFE